MGAFKMDSSKVLISMARYIHAFYDIEIDVKDPNLQVKLKRFMDKTDDAKLVEYWDDYKSLINPDYERQASQISDKKAEPKESKPAVYYRGVKVESTDEVDDENSQGSNVTYRGKKI